MDNTLPITVLAIDDDPGDLELLSRYLEDIRGLAITLLTAEDWRQGRQVLATTNVDLIILDYLLGADTGLTVVRALRESGDKRPVVILTGKGDERIAAEVSRAGADDYLVKGDLSADLLRRVITSVLRQYRLNKEKALLTAKLKQVQRMETIGTLAGGIAHDFNNILTAIMGHVELARIKAGSGAVEQDLEKIQSSCRQMAKLVQRLLNFSRRGSTEKTLVDLRQIIQEMRTVLRHTLAKNVKIVVETSEESIFITANGAMLHQILLNLCVNAAEAMPAGGTLTLRLRKTRVEADFAEHHPPLKAGENILIEVEDTGCGIPADIQAKIFDPFFSTKERGVKKGTGLGLAVTWQNVKEHDGCIIVDSEPGKGAMFRIYLPPGPIRSEYRQNQEAEADIPRGSETVFIVEDEMRIREMARELLESLGYTVLTAGNGYDAVEMYAARHETIDLIILDLSMPGMDGRFCLDQLLSLEPRTKVLFASGHDMTDAEEQLRKIGAKGVLQKPFRMGVLARKVRNVLDG